MYAKTNIHQLIFEASIETRHASKQNWYQSCPGEDDYHNAEVHMEVQSHASITGHRYEMHICSKEKIPIPKKAGKKTC